jgi:hypothetical protein
MRTNMNPKLLPRLQRVPKEMKGNTYYYHPMTPLTQPDGLEAGQKVQAVSDPEGKGTRKIVRVTKYTWNNNSTKEYTVFVGDLATYIKDRY